MRDGYTEVWTQLAVDSQNNVFYNINSKERLEMLSGGMIAFPMKTYFSLDLKKNGVVEHAILISVEAPNEVSCSSSFSAFLKPRAHFIPYTGLESWKS